MKCFYHPDIDAATQCSQCAKPLCDQCAIHERGEPCICSSCAVLYVSRDAGSGDTSEPGGKTKKAEKQSDNKSLDNRYSIENLSEYESNWQLIENEINKS